MQTTDTRALEARVEQAKRAVDELRLELDAAGDAGGDVTDKTNEKLSIAVAVLGNAQAALDRAKTRQSE